MNYAGRAAAATLGFIAGDVPGAFIAEEAYRNLYKNKKMSTPSTLRTKRRRTSTISLGGAPLKRRKSMSSRSSSSRRSSASTRSITKLIEKPIAQTATTVRHKTLKKSHKAKKKKYVKVPKKLKKQILQVFDTKLVTGYGRFNYLGCAINLNVGDYTAQKVFPYPLPRVTAQNAGQFFDPYFIMYCASRLWNNRLAEGNGLVTGALTNMQVEKNDTDGWSNFSQPLATSVSAFKVMVTELKAKMIMKNNTGRTAYLKMYVCKPKYQRNDTSANANGLPITDWNKCLENDWNASIEGINTTTNRAGPINVPISSGFQSVSSYTYNVTPMMSANWKRQWSANMYEIILEPGQTHTHWLDGDAGEYDFSKMYTKSTGNSASFNNVQKTDRFVFFTGVPELASSASLDTRLQSTSTQKIIFETQLFVTMKMPESAGTSITNIGNLISNSAQTQPLTQRHRSYFIDSFHENVSSSNGSLTVNYDDNYTGLQTQ